MAMLLASRQAADAITIDLAFMLTSLCSRSIDGKKLERTAKL
jgi:hypothetical protein